MKRPAEDISESAKQMKLDGGLESPDDQELLPPNMDNPFEADFTAFAASRPHDVIIKAGILKLHAHKKILAACSSVLKDIFEGDADADTVTFNTDEDTLCLFHELLYKTPEERTKQELLRIHRESGNIWEFASRYDCKMTLGFIIWCARCQYFFNGEGYAKFCEFATQLNLPKVVDALEESQIYQRMKPDLQIETFTPQLVLKMIKTHNFNSQFSFFDRILKYLKTHNSPEIQAALVDVCIKYGKGPNETTSYKTKWSLQKSKSEAVLKFAGELLAERGGSKEQFKALEEENKRLREKVKKAEKKAEKAERYENYVRRQANNILRASLDGQPNGFENMFRIFESSNFNSGAE